MAGFIPFRVDGGWAIHIDPDTLTVLAVKNWTNITIEFVAKTLRQAWFAYHNPYKVDGLLKGHENWGR